MFKKLSAIIAIFTIWILIGILAIVGFLFLGEALAQPAPKPATVIASFYGVGDGFHGRRTANGERFNAHAMTAAHRHYKFGTKLRVTNARTGQSVVVRVNDRGPFVHGRGIDLSYGAAKAIGVTGTAPVIVEKI